MGTKLIEMDDGVLVEVSTDENEITQISGGAADRVDGSIERIKPLLISACKPVAAVWDELNQDLHIAQAEISLGIGFEGNGQFFIAQAKAKANLNVKLVLKPKASE